MNSGLFEYMRYAAGPAVLVLVLALVFFWVTQFVQLMLLEDKLFPGKCDKILWAAAFIFLPPLAPFAFRAWKSAMLAQRPAGK